MNKNVSLTSFPRLETERLFLRQETPEDAPAVFTVFSDPKVTQFHDLDTFTKLEEAFGVIERRTKRFEIGRGIRWGIAPVQDNTLIGSCGFTWDTQAMSADIGNCLKRLISRCDTS